MVIVIVAVDGVVGIVGVLGVIEVVGVLGVVVVCNNGQLRQLREVILSTPVFWLLPANYT